MSFCDFVKGLRERNRLTQAQMAQKLGVSVNTIKQIEANKIKTPSNRVLDSFCNYLNEDRLTIITKILFKINREVRCNDKYYIEQADLLLKYMSYLYLKGWNIDKVPVTYRTKDLGNLIYAGQLTKKREPNNKIVIVSISDTFKEDTNYISNDEAVHYITSSMTAFFCVDEIVLRGIHILFNSNSDNQTKLFEIFKGLKMKRITFNYQLILFDSKKGIIVDSKEL